MTQSDCHTLTFDRFQRKVIDISSGTHLVLAAPGCGKTAILAQRVREAIGNGVDPAKMLCLTFTNRAARNMVGRMTELAEKDLFVGNIHRFCSRLLFEKEIISPGATIIDETDATSIIIEIRNEKTSPENATFNQKKSYDRYIGLHHLLDQYRNGHPKEIMLNSHCFDGYKMRSLCNAMGLDYTRRAILDIYDSINSREDIDRLLTKYSFGYIELLDQMLYARKYAEYKTLHHLVDFDDILIKAYDYLASDSPHDRYSWVQVDEVQDLNPLQIAIVDLITEPDGCTLYLGDEQQAIFSFIGATQGIIKKLENRCAGNIHRLEKNYRSPRYLLDVFNTYAINVLGVNGEMLPTPSGDERRQFGNLTIKYSYSNTSAMADIIKSIRNNGNDSRTAVIVPTNKDADTLSDLATAAGIPHFKISGTDYFSEDPVQLAINHLRVLRCDTDFMAWAKIFKCTATKGVRQLETARKTALKLKSAAITPSDFICYDEGSYVTHFLKAYRDRTCVIFDTETSGLDVFEDDIIQLAAIKVEDGKVIDSLNIFLDTDRPIPPMLGETVNPLAAEYATAPKTVRDEGLRQFLEFAKGCVLIGHNIEFDYHILHFNLLRSRVTGELSALFPEYYDTLKLARLLLREQQEFKLKTLLEELGLEGVNSHLANDDIMATKSLADHLYDEIRNHDFFDIHRKMLARTAAFRDIFKSLYGKTYLDGLARLYKRGLPYPIAGEFAVARKWFENNLPDNNLDKFDYIIKYIMEKIDENTGITPTSSLHEQIEAVSTDIGTYKESDLCDSEIIKEKIFISTVHKAKGLEFENVIVYGVVEGTYPHFASTTEEEKLEDARKLYVALSRARRSLTIMAYDNYEYATASGTRCFKKELSPFIRPISPYFTTQNYYTPTSKGCSILPDENSRAEESQDPYYEDRGL